MRNRPEESLGAPLAGSVAFHAALLGAVVWSGYWLQRNHPPDFGDPNPTGSGTVAVESVKRIPIFQPDAPKNLVAHETKSTLPTPTRPVPVKAVPKEDPTAIALRGRDKKKEREPKVVAQRYQPNVPDRPNQLKASEQRLSSTMYGITGAGGVGIGASNPFGNRFGAYAEEIRRRVAERWQTGDLGPNRQAAVLTFTLLRNGTVQNVQLSASSGDYSVDRSAQRAVIEAAPFPPMPSQFERDSANVEFSFVVRK